MQPSPQTDRLMAEIRGNLAVIAAEAASGREAPVAFRNNEAGYEEWIKAHEVAGYVLHRDTASAKTAHLHAATCPVIGGEEGMTYTKSPKVGCATMTAALTFAQQKKWEVNKSCDQCVGRN